MLPKQHRLQLKLEPDFFRRANKLVGRKVLIYFQSRTDDQIKAAIIVPKKNIPKATARNRLKRQLRAAIISLLPELKSLNLVIYFKAKSKKNDYHQLLEEIKLLLGKINREFWR